MARDQIRAPQTFFSAAGARGFATPWQPPADVYRTHDGWLVKLDLAGVRPEDLHVCACGKRLTVSGKRRDCSLEEGCCSYRMEIAYSQFERCLELPNDVDRAHVASEYRDGMLLIRIQTET